MSLLLCLIACPRPSPIAVGPAAPYVLAPLAPKRHSVASGGYWSEPGGLCLEVPNGWYGSWGPPPRVLELRHPSGVSLAVDVWPAAADVPPTPDVWELSFEDPDGYRSVPVLSPSSTATWTFHAQPGPTRQTWSGDLGGRHVRVEATYPFGIMVLGRDAVEPVLEALCTTYQ